MALNNCSQLGYDYSLDFCMNVGVEKDQDEFTVDEAWIAGAFFLGLILGAGLVAILTKPFLNAWQKKKQQDEEGLLGTKAKDDVVEAKTINGWADKRDKVPMDKDKKTFFKAPRFWRKKKLPMAQNDEPREVKEGDVDPALSRGMIDVMLQTNSTSAEVEMADQDMAAIVALERSGEEEKEALMLRVLSMLLKKKMEKRAITENFFINFMKKTEEDVKDLSKMIAREKEEAEEKLRNDPKLNKDSQALETKMQILQTHYNNKQSKLQRDYRDKIRLDMLRSSGMSEAEVEEIMAKLMNNMAMVEEKLGLEQARQRRALEQRLAKRRQAVAYREIEAKEAEQDMETRVSTLKNLIAFQLNDDGNLEKQADGVMNEYANDLDIIKKFHSKEYDGLSLEKCQLLHSLRLNSFFKLSKKQEKEKAIMMQTSGKTANPADFIKLYHDLVTKHHMEQEALCLELDQKEVQELHKIKQDIANRETKAMDKEAEKYMEKIENVTDLTTADADKILKLHKSQMANYYAKKQKEKQAMLARLQERLQQRLAAADEAEARDQREQEVLKEEQMATMAKVMTTNMDLTEEAKNRVLREHEQNMQALSNQLQRSKLRQQKSLEIKLNQRKARLAELKQQQEDLKKSKKLMKEKEKEDLEAKLAAEIAKEEEAFEVARQAAVAELRRQLAKETEEALKQQDEEIGLLIGRLQVGQARRQAILEKQDNQLKQLQEELERRVSTGEALPSTMTDQIIQQHYNHVAHLNEQLQRRRDKQERTIMEKLSAKKTMMEEEIETQLEEQAQSEYTQQQKRGAGYASLALMQAFLEQRHAQAMSKLETEMLAELEKCKSDLNKELELELKKELEVQKQEFLGQLSSISHMSRRDLEDAVSAAASGRSDDKGAKRLTQDLRTKMDRSKTTVANDFPRDSGYDIRRTKTELNRSQGFEYDAKSRKGSATGPNYKNTWQAYTDEDDDDYENGF